jgi:hypothetical protein
MAVTSFKSNLFLNIQARVVSEMTEIKHVDKDFGQIDFKQQSADRYPVMLPCVLIEFGQFQYAQKQGFQRVKGTVRLKLATEKWESSSEEILLATREQAIQDFELAHKFYTKFQYWDGGSLLNVLPFYRFNDTVEKRELDGLHVVAIDYVFEYDDTSAG